MEGSGEGLAGEMWLQGIVGTKQGGWLPSALPPKAMPTPRSSSPAHHSHDPTPRVKAHPPLHPCLRECQTLPPLVYSTSSPTHHCRGPTPLVSPTSSPAPRDLAPITSNTFPRVPQPSVPIR